MKSAASVLRSEKIILDGEHLDVRSVQVGNWRYTHWVFAAFPSPDLPNTTDVLIFPQPLTQIDATKYDPSIGELVKLAYESVRGKPTRIFYVIENTTVRLNGAYVERRVLIDGVERSEAMHISNPYLRDWLKGSREIDGERKVA